MREILRATRGLRVESAGAKALSRGRGYLAGLKPHASTFSLVLALVVALAAVLPARAQLLGEPPIPAAKEKKAKKQRGADLEWMWQYSPPPAEGRENELIQDPHFRPFLDEYFKQPQAFWGPNPTDLRAPLHKSLADTANDFLVIPGRVVADENRYITITGAVRRMRTSRGLIFADLNVSDPLVVFAAIDWIRDSRPTDDPAAEYTLFIFANKLLPGQTAGNLTDTVHLPPALERSLARWIVEPLAGSGIVQKIAAAVLVDADGTPHQIAVPVPAAAPVEAAPLTKRR